MAKGPEESDGRILPQGRLTALSTAVGRGGKATTDQEEVRQLALFSETADSPQGDSGGADLGQPGPAPCEVPKSEDDNSQVWPAMTMEEVARPENLRNAFERIAANQGAPGVDGQGIEQVRQGLPKLLPKLSQALLAGTYQPGETRRVHLPKAGGGQRDLGIPNVVDRLVQQAVLQVMSPHYEPTFHPSSHGFRPGRSCHSAIAEAKTHLEHGNQWVVDLDLEKFFDRVHHDRLVSRLAERVKDPRLLALIRRMRKAKVVLPDGVVTANEEGVVQGGPLSPLLSNIVLDELDWELARRGHRFVRYADDANIYVRSQRAGERVMASVRSFIERRLRLKVNEAKSAVALPEERHFLGFRLRRDAETGEVQVLLSKRSEERIKEKVRQLTPRNWGQSLRECIEGLNRYLRGWINFFSICTGEGARIFQTLDGRIRRRLRAIVLKQWKRKWTIVQQLVRRGVKSWLAYKTVYKGRRNRWQLSHTEAVDRGLRNRYFRERGLLSLWDTWKERQAQEGIAPT